MNTLEFGNNGITKKILLQNTVQASNRVLRTGIAIHTIKTTVTQRSVRYLRIFCGLFEMVCRRYHLYQHNMHVVSNESVHDYSCGILSLNNNTIE